jgi:catechol 2,3-dioxygenase-like lactoylglutathione lyase family enzyme
MKPRITFLTLRVDDLERSLAFYCDDLGFPTKGIVGTEFEHGDVVFIDCEHGLELALYSRDNLAYDATIPRTPPSSADFSIGHLVESQQAVDAVVEQARRAGATIAKTLKRPFGVAITLTSRTRTDTYGKLPGILTRSG